MRKNIKSATLALLLATTTATAQDWLDNDKSGKLDLARQLAYKVEAQVSLSDGHTPLWLNANKHGLSSLKSENGYMRAAITRPLQADSARRWAVGYSLDMVAPAGYTSHVVVQQAYAELRWLHGVLSVGSKEWPMQMKNNALSSGSQTLGINARPVPQVRLALPDYWVPPFGGGWIRFKGHLAYGKMTDDSWQHDFTDRKSKYADDVLYHSKAGYIKIGNEDRFMPWSLELGLEMAATFGGTSHRKASDGTMETLKGENGLWGFWHAFVPGGHDAGESLYRNIGGNHVGSWMASLNYDGDAMAFSIYADKYFEDHSAMLLLDYDGYGQGDNWQKKQKSKFFVYDMKDMMLGMELNLKRCYWLSDIVVEYLYTKYQSGPVYHDHTASFSDHVGGKDNYYNHYVYTGWQHWGQVIGNPLYRSPIYNDDGTIEVKDSRFMAFHLGLDGRPTERLSYRALATWQEGLGTYAMPYTHKRHNVSFMAEATYRLNKGWQVRGAYGMDFGSILGHNAGMQLTVSKSGLLGH